MTREDSKKNSLNHKKPRSVNVATVAASIITQVNYTEGCNKVYAKDSISKLSQKLESQNLSEFTTF